VTGRQKYMKVFALKYCFSLIEKWVKVEGEDNFIVTNTKIELDNYEDPVLFLVSSDFCT